ncbi:MAG: hypothetical protein EHM45_06470 [Desulfobacteraceae bacterium]|nr:MAG: hypothetical protein EHM45_06470 [Desulfobacteraceae bacterium]
MKPQNTTKLIEAQRLITEAARMISEVSLDESWGTGRADCAHFANELQEFLSCDHGQAGFVAYVNKMQAIESRPIPARLLDDLRLMGRILDAERGGMI